MWVYQALEDRITMTGDVIHEKWWCFVRAFNIPKDQWPVLSKGWLTRFKEWNGLKDWKKHSEAGSQRVATADVKRKQVQEICLLFKLCNIYNLDETGLFWG